ncbi:MAG: beta-hydroxyacyl-ACP dehydratase [Bacteroidales bacterium]|nr:beta-hydroxyacyl-ACP dehydratase [Bacteroidales bacterium]
MNREEIMQHIPHREPMLLVDEATMDADGTGHGKYRIRDDEFFCRGHFPGNPMVPGVILCEIMAQSCTITMLDALVDNLAVYRGIDDVKFKNTVRPGDLCEITCRVEEKKANIIRCTAKLEVGGKLCCRGTLTFALIPLQK